MTLPSWIGDLSHLEPYDPVILSDHAKELRQNFRLGGMDAFSKSTVAGMLKRAELYSSGTKPCTRCGGYIPVNDEDPNPERPGCGFIPSNSKRCQEVTRKQAEFLALLDISADEIPIAADTPCPDCGCHGWVVAGTHPTGAITARPSSSPTVHRQSFVGTSYDGNLHILGICSRRLERADELLPITSAGLAAYFEPGGGGTLAMWHLVPAGKTMLRQNKRDVPPYQFFTAARLAQESNKNPKVDAQFKACDEQARQLLDAIGRAWNAAVALEVGRAA